MNALIAEARRMVPSLSRGMPVVYFLRLRSGIIYIGASIDLAQRLDDHVSGQACRTTLKAEAWETLKCAIARPFEKPKSGRIAVKVINHLGDKVMKFFRIT